jgi:hypothetical protein
MKLGALEDRYVAFFGPQFPPEGAIPAKPYILRYAAASLDAVTEDGPEGGRSGESEGGPPTVG